jgi:rhamnosyltransferase
MNCSIVIRAYNEERHIGRLLEGIGRQTVREADIIVVDSGSTDATASIAARSGATVVPIPPAEFTFGHSLNLGVAKTTRDLVVIVSAHAYPVYPDWLERLLEAFADPQVALAYGRQRGDRTSHFSEQQILNHWFPQQSNPRQTLPFCNNANAAIRRSIWEEYPFDESLTGLEDLAWAKTALSHGFILSYVAEAEVIHLHREMPRGIYNRYRREAMAFKQLYPEAHFSLYDFLRMTTANIRSDLWQATRLRTLWPSAASIFWFRTMQFWGTYQGYRHSPEWNWQLRRTFYYPDRKEIHPRKAPRPIEPIRYNK